MRDRIKLILEHYGLTQTKFAQLIGVSKGMVSHVMSANGRHSVFTESTISKIKEVFPKINIEWLVTGKGDMFTMNTVSNLHANEPSLFDSPVIEHVNIVNKLDSNDVNTPTIDETTEKDDAPIARNIPNSNVSDTPKAEYKRLNPATDYNSSVQPPSKSVGGKTASRIVIFYTDGTYSEYKPDMTSY